MDPDTYASPETFTGNVINVRGGAPVSEPSRRLPRRERRIDVVLSIIEELRPQMEVSRRS